MLRLFPQSASFHFFHLLSWCCLRELIFHCRGRDSNALLSLDKFNHSRQGEILTFSTSEQCHIPNLFRKKRILKCWGGSLKRQDRQMIQGINYTTYSVWCSANCEEEEKAHWKMLWDTPPGGALPLEDSKHKLTKLGRCNSWRIELLSNGNARLAIKDWKKQRARYNCKEIWIGWKFSQVIGTARNCLVGSRGTSKYQNQNLEQPHRRLIDWLMIDYVKTDLLW